MKFNWFFKKDPKASRPLIIMIHGFGKRRIDEFNPLYEALKDDYDIIRPYLYDQRYISDNKWYNWVSKAEEELVKAKNNKRDIILVGFSMGGVIASYLASKFAIKKLVLLAPAFEYITITTAKDIVTRKLSNKKEHEDGRYLKLPSEFTNTFMEVVDNCKSGIERVNCPTLILACSKDEVISFQSSVKAYKKIPHANKNCIIFEGGAHRILDDEHISSLAIANIKHFISDDYNK